MGCSVSRAHKTWSRSLLFKDFLESVVVAGTSYQMLNVLKSTMKNLGVSIFLTIRKKTLNQGSYS